MAAPTHECFRAAFTQEPNQTIQPKQAISKALVTSQEPSALRVLKHKKPSDKRISIPTNPAKPDSYSTIEHKVAAVMGSPQATTTPASKDQISQSVTTRTYQRLSIQLHCGKASQEHVQDSKIGMTTILVQAF